MLVERDVLESVVSSVSRRGQVKDITDEMDNADGELADADQDLSELGEYLHVIDSFKVPKFSFMVDSKTFVQLSDCGLFVYILFL